MKLKKTLVMVLAACLLVGTLAGTAFADDDWAPAVTPADTAWYIEPTAETQKPVGEIVLLTKDGPVEGILLSLPEKTTGWKMYGDNWTYYKNGELQHHWQKIDGNWYYFNTYGIMVQRGVAWIENRLYYFDENGVCDTTPGWKYVPSYFYIYENEKQYISHPGTGYAWFYLNQNGFIQTGWNYIDGTWHMCDKVSGRMLCNEWYMGEGGYWYYFDEYTDMATGWMTVRDELKTDRTYYFNESGVLQWGWLNLGGNWYYLNPVNAARVENSWALIPGRDGDYWYLFDDDGVMQTGWQFVLVGKAPSGEKDDKGKDIMIDVGNWYYLTSWGGLVTGYYYVNGNWYWFDDEDGALLSVWNAQYGVWETPDFKATNYLEPGESDKEKDPVPSQVVYTK
jgi:glucan-binding YG repeat protein